MEIFPAYDYLCSPICNFNLTKDKHLKGSRFSKNSPKSLFFTKTMKNILYLDQNESPMQNYPVCYASLQNIEIVRYVCIFSYPKMWHLAPETHYKNLKTNQEK